MAKRTAPATAEHRREIAEMYRLYFADGLSQSEAIKKLAANLGRSADGIREILKREGIALVPSRQSTKVFENSESYPQAGEAENAEFDARYKPALDLCDFRTFDGFSDILELGDELEEIGQFSNQIESGIREIETSEDYEVVSRQPKILLFDIETAPNKAYVWGHYEQNVLGYVAQWYMLAFCAKWVDGEVISRCLPDYEGYQPGTENDKAIIEELWTLFNEADVIIGHNLDSFDIGKSNARFIIHGLAPPAPYKTIDTKKVARRYFKFNSNKLDDLGNTLGVGRKIKHTGFDLWLECMAGDPEAWEVMRMYNRQDVLLLERVYNKLKSWMTNHPNMAILSETKNACPVCGSLNLERKGYAITNLGRKERYQCADCGTWANGKQKKFTDIG